MNQQVTQNVPIESHAPAASACQAVANAGTRSGWGVQHAGASFPQVRIAKKPKLPHKSQERPALQHELLAFSGFAGLRLFAAFVKLDQGFRMKLSPALKTHHRILQTIGWSEVSSLKVMISSGFCQLLRSRTRRSGSPPFTM